MTPMVSFPQDPDLYEELKRRLRDLTAAQPLEGNKVEILKRYFEFDTTEVRWPAVLWGRKVSARDGTAHSDT